MDIKTAYTFELCNTQQIQMFREGLFWRACERSAFALFRLVYEFKPIKRKYKVLGGEEVVFVGFPTNSTDKFLGKMQIAERTDDRLVVSLSAPIDLDAFKQWKDAVELTEKKKVAERNVPDANMAEAEYALRVLSRLRAFNLADSTPMQCMMFLNDLKTDGTLR